jgi:chorismate mutase
MRNSKKDVLTEFRREINKIDDAILCLLSERLRIVRKLHVVKRRFGIAIFDRGREAQIIARLQRKFPRVGARTIAKLYKVVLGARRNRAV